MNTIFMGTPQFAATVLEALVNGGFKPAAVFTNPDKQSGRGHKLTELPVKTLAQSLGIPVYQPTTLKNNAEVIDTISEIQPDVIVVAAYGKILPSEVINLPRLGCLNTHASLLPKFRGASAINAAIREGEKKTGVTIMQIAPGLDTGDIITAAATDIKDGETVTELTARLAHIGGDLLVEVLNHLDNGERLTPTPQDDSLATFVYPITKSECRIDWDKPADKVRNFIHSLSDNPAAFTEISGKRLKVYRADITNETQDFAVGTVLIKKGLYVVCSNGETLKLTEVAPENGKRMSGAAFAAGAAKHNGVVLT
ncbi:MAG: methionyl-tRNA formyltransferase [Oscillospiraceae bacterium]|jgi:methionyl-tRNA formyltransferase|nr:methionyl-tRNA formyltransferase [Oscillospiraceae bacterium]